MSTGHRIKVKGVRVDKAGKLVPCSKHKDVSARIRERASKRVRVKRHVTHDA